MSDGTVRLGVLDAKLETQRRFDMCAFRFVLAGLMGLAATAAVMGCAPTTSAPMAQQACPAGVPLVPAGYANGKWVPDHCQGHAAQ
jgi:hypothetical protein